MALTEDEKMTEENPIIDQIDLEFGPADKQTVLLPEYAVDGRLISVLLKEGVVPTLRYYRKALDPEEPTYRTYPLYIVKSGTSLYGSGPLRFVDVIFHNEAVHHVFLGLNPES